LCRSAGVFRCAGLFLALEKKQLATGDIYAKNPRSQQKNYPAGGVFHQIKIPAHNKKITPPEASFI
jgi:hypothetical protein